MSTVLITGTNRGIGLELVRQFADAGDRVIACCRRPEAANELNALAHQLALADQNARIIVEELEVSNAESIQKLADRLMERGEKLDMLINNAGMLVEENFGEWTAPAFSATLETNVVGPALVIQSLSRLLNDASKVINISSGLGSLGMKINFGGNTGTYAVSKAALNMVTSQAAAALSPRGIIVASYNPGWVKTDMGGSEADLEIHESASSLRASFAALTIERSGSFIDYNGENLDW